MEYKKGSNIFTESFALQRIQHGGGKRMKISNLNLGSVKLRIESYDTTKREWEWKGNEGQIIFSRYNVAKVCSTLNRYAKYSTRDVKQSAIVSLVKTKKSHLILMYKHDETTDKYIMKLVLTPIIDGVHKREQSSSFLLGGDGIERLDDNFKTIAIDSSLVDWVSDFTNEFSFRAGVNVAGLDAHIKKAYEAEAKGDSGDNKYNKYKSSSTGDKNPFSS